jgi:indolepyruvate ferredoxin oxidoreductase
MTAKPELDPRTSFTREEGEIHIGGIDALVRLTMDQVRIDPDFLARLRSQFANGYVLKYHLAPPLLSKRDPVSDELQKRDFEPWVLTAFKILAKLKGLRGGPLDIFGRTSERRHERRLIEESVANVDEIVAQISAGNHAAAVQLASVPNEIRGYGHVKERSITAAQMLHEQCLSAFRRPQAIAIEAAA